MNDSQEILEVFKYKTNKMNISNFEDPKFIHLLDKASKESNIPKRQKEYFELEKYLMQKMPVIPLFYTLDYFAKKEYIQGENFLPTGEIDFKEAYIHEDFI